MTIMEGFLVGSLSKETVNVGIIGCGGIATGKHLPSLKKVPEARLVGFHDMDAPRAQDAAKRFGVADAKVYASYQELLDDPTIDVVHILTPNSSHAEITVNALEAGKHVMCEKPMAKTSEEARRMVEAAKRTGNKLTIGYQNRFRPDSQHLHALCQRGDLGEVYFGKGLAIRRRAVPTWGVFLDEEKQGGGPLIDIGTHALDLTLWMMGNYKPKVVLGTAYHKLGSQANSANAWGAWDPEKFTVEDSAFGFIVMENGASIVLESSWALNTLQVGEARTVLCGTKAGADMLDGLRINGEEFGRLYAKQVQLGADGVDFYDGSQELSAADLEARQWIECILHDTDPLVKPEEALVVTAILEAIYESSRTGKAVYF